MARYTTLELLRAPSFVNKVLISNTGTFTTPAGVSYMRVTVQGAGGNGSGACAGGGGAWAQRIVTTAPGLQYCVLSASSGGCPSCFPGTCAQGGGAPTGGTATGGDLNINGCPGGTTCFACSDKAGTCSAGSGGGGGGGRSALQTSGANAGGCRAPGAGGRGSAGAAGATTSCGCPAIAPATTEIGFESGGAGAGGTSPSFTNSTGSLASGGGTNGSGGRGYVVIEF